MTPSINKGIIDTISLASKYPTIKKIGIFGSYARGSNNKDSDIDLLYDYDDTKEQSTDELLSYVEEINDILISSSSASKIDYVWYRGIMESSNSQFRNAILNDVIWVYSRE